MNLIFSSFFLLSNLISRVYSECLVSPGVNQCNFCKATHYTTEKTLPFDPSTCKTKNPTPYNRDILVVSGADVAAGDWPTSDKYLSLDAALLKESDDSISYANCQLNFILTKGEHYLIRKTFANSPKQIFRRSSCTITISPLLCSKKNIAGKCLEFPKDASVVPTVNLKSSWSYFFISNVVTIENLIFDGSDLHFPTGSDLNNDGKCYNSASKCCDDTNIIKTSTENSECGVKEKSLDSSYANSFGLFNIESFPDASTFSPAVFNLKNVQFSNFWLINKEGGYYSLIRMTMSSGSLNIEDLKLRTSLLPESFLVIESDSSKVDSQFYLNAIKSMISSLSAADLKKSHIKFTGNGMEIDNYNYVSVSNTNQIKQIFSFDSYKGNVNVIIHLNNSTQIGTVSSLFNIVSTTIIFDNLTINNCKELAIGKLKDAIATIKNLTILSTNANSNQDFIYSETSSLVIQNFTMNKTIFAKDKFALNSKESTLTISQGLWSENQKLSIYFEKKTFIISSLKILSSTFQQNFIKANLFDKLEISKTNLDSLTKETNGIGIFAISSIYSSTFLSNFTLNDIFVTKCTGNFIFLLDKVNITDITKLNISENTGIGSLWAKSTFHRLSVNKLDIIACEFGQVFEMDEAIPHEMKFIDFTIRGLKLTGWVFFFYSNGIMEFTNLDFKDLVMSVGGYTYMFVTLQKSYNKFTNFTCIDCGYLNESPSYLANQAEMSLVAGWQAEENVYINLTVRNSGKKLNFNGAVLVHITVFQKLILHNVTMENSYSTDDNFVYRGVVLTNPTIVEIINSTFINMKCPDTPQWRQSFQYANGAILAYESFSLSYSPNSKSFLVKNVSLKDCACSMSGGGFTAVNYHLIVFSGVKVEKSKADKGGVLAIFSSSNVTIEDFYSSDSQAIEGAAFYISVVNGPLVLQNVNIKGTKGTLTGALHIMDCSDFRIYNSGISDASSSDKAGGFYFESSKGIFQNMTANNVKSATNGGFMLSVNCPDLNIMNVSSVSTEAGSGGFIYSDSTTALNLTSISLVSSKALYDGGAIYAISSSSFTVSDFFASNGVSQTGMINYMSFAADEKIKLNNITCDACKSSIVSCLRYESPSNISVIGLNIRNGVGRAIEAIFPYSFIFNLENLMISNMTNNINIVYFSRVNLTLKNFNIENCVSNYGIIFFDNCPKSELIGGNFKNCGKNDSINTAMYFENSNAQLSHIKATSNNVYKYEIIESLKSIITISSLDITGLSSNENSGIVKCVISDFKIFGLNCRASNGPCVFVSSCRIYIENGQLEDNQGNNIGTSDLHAEGISDITLKNWKATNSNKTSIYIHDINSLSIEGSSFIRSSISEMRGIDILNLKNLQIHVSTFYNLNIERSAGVQIKNTKSSTNKIEISNSVCNNSKSLIGTCFLIDGKHNSSFRFNKFSNNIANAHSKNIESGVGASIIDNCHGFTNNCSFEAKNNLFENNFAAKLGPNLVSSSNNNSVFNNTFVNNSEALKINVSTYLAPFKLIHGLREQNVIIASGQYIDLHFGFTDKEGKYIGIYSNSIGNLIPLSEGVTLENQLSNLRSNGSLVFSKFKMKFSPGKNTTLKLSLAIIMPELFLTNSILTLEKNFNFVSRRCIKGEIFYLEECRQCSTGTYSLMGDPMEEPSSAQVCQGCPENSECLRKYILPRKGFWKFNENATKMLKCLNEDYCLGGFSVSKIKSGNLTSADKEIIDHGQCYSGHIGILCNSCEKGKGKLGPKGFCEPCRDQMAISIIRTVFIIILVVAYIVFMSKIYSNTDRKSAFASFLLKLMINHFQVLSIITFNQVGLNVSFINFGLEFANILNFRIDYFSSDCLLAEMGSNNRDLKIAKVAASLVIPIILSFISLVTWVLIALCLKKSKKSMNSFVYQKRILISFVVSIYLFYPMIIGSCFSLLNCIEVDKGIWVLFTEPELFCWRNPHNEYLLQAAVPGLLVWGMAFPIFLYFILRKQKQYLIKLSNYLRSMPSIDSKLDRTKKKPSSSSKITIKKSSTSKLPKDNLVIEKANPQFPDSSLSKSDNVSKSNPRYAHISPKMDRPNSPSRSSKKEESIEDGRPRASPLLEEEIFSFFYDGYKLETIYWEAIVLLKKLVLTFISSLTEYMPPITRNTIIMLILFYFFSATIKYVPFKNKSCNALEYFSLATLLITIFSAVINLQISNFGIKFFMSMIVLVLNLAFLCAVCYVILKNTNFRNKIAIFKGKKKEEGNSKAKTV